MTDALDHPDRPALVRHARAPVRRHRRHLQLLLSHLRISARTLTGCLIPPALWTTAMIGIALAVRY